MMSKMMESGNSSKNLFSLPEKTRTQLLNHMKETWKNFIFRRVAKVVFTGSSKPDRVLKCNPVQDDKGEITIFKEDITASFDPKKVSDNDMKYLEFQYDMFAFFCSKDELRNESKTTKGQEIYAASGKYNQLDMLMDPTSMGVLFHPELRDNNIPPRIGDLICLEAEPGPKGMPQAKWWFNCSDQFMHLWTYVMYEKHPSFDKIPNPLTGNYLQTNTYLKWIMGYRHSGEKAPLEEAKKRYFRLRTEDASRQWVHIYCALFVMVKQKTIPNWTNIPNNQSETKKLAEWDVPSGFIDSILKTHTTFFKDLPSDDPRKKSVDDIVFGRNEQMMNVCLHKIKQENPKPPEDFSSLSSKTPIPPEKPATIQEATMVDDSLIQKLEDVIRADFAKKREDMQRLLEEERKKEMKALEERYTTLLSSKMKDIDQSMEIALQNVKSSLRTVSKK